MDTTSAALIRFARAEIVRYCEEQPFDLFSNTRFLGWQQLESATRAAHPGKPWLRNVILVRFDAELDLHMVELSLPFATAPCAEELAAAIIDAADRQGITGPALVFDAVTGDLRSLESYRTIAPPKPMHAARGLLRRAGQRTVPQRRRVHA